jgi:hypothetical protein
MKHLKLYENKGDKFGIFSCVDTEDSNNNIIKIFDDLESAQNYYIDFVNASKENDIWREKRREMLDNEYITTLEEANDYSDNELYTLIFQCEEIENSGKFNLPEHIILSRDIRKYNI